MSHPPLSPNGFADAALARVVQLVREGSATTRLDLLHQTGLGRAIIRQRVDQAISLGLLEESGLGESTGGRTPRLLRFPAASAHIVLAALGATSAQVGVSDLSGALLASKRYPWDITTGPDATLERVHRELRSLLGEVPPRPVWGVGVGLPGPVEFSTGRPTVPPIMPGWNGVDVRGRLQDVLHAPVWVDNDVNVLAMGERGRHPADKSRYLLYVKVGSGVGAGIMSNGAIHRGADGAAGDIGHLVVRGSTTRCRCGQTGCLEATAGGWALCREGEQAAADGRSPALAAALETRDRLRAQDIFDAAGAGDPYAVDAVISSARIIGEALATLVNVVNPSLVILGGGEADLGEAYLATVRETVYRRSLPLATRNLQIVPPQNDGRDGLRGAAALVADQLFGAAMADWVASGSPVDTILQSHALSA